VELAIWERFNAKCWPEHLNGAAAYFRCSSCRSSADVLLLPASREKAPPVPQDNEADGWFAMPDPGTTWGVVSGKVATALGFHQGRCCHLSGNPIFGRKRIDYSI